MSKSENMTKHYFENRNKNEFGKLTSFCKIKDIKYLFNKGKLSKSSIPGIIDLSKLTENRNIRSDSFE